MREYGMPPARRRGELNPNAKLSNYDARRMRELRAEKHYSHRDLQRIFGSISLGAVSCLLRGLSYKDAGGPIETEYRYVKSKLGS